MIWLVSYPRSGNTFCRNVLFHTYGLDSQAYFLGNKDLDQVDDQYPVMKTHHLPEDTPFQSDDVIVYLIRDGRDSIVSMANQMVNLTKPGSKFPANVDEILTARGNDHFGGWSKHAEQWQKHATVTIFFHDLIADPVQELEKLRSFCNLPDPNLENIPTFQSQKTGQAKFKGKDASLFFHQGKVGSWKDSLSAQQLALFYERHGKTLVAFGFESELPASTHSGHYSLMVMMRKLRAKAKKLLATRLPAKRS